MSEKVIKINPKKSKYAIATMFITDYNHALTEANSVYKDVNNNSL